MSYQRREKLKIHVRPMAMCDVAEVAAIDYHTYPDPWSDTDYEYCVDGNYMCEVAVHCGEVVGFSVCILSSTMISVEKLIVKSNYRRQTVGSQMLTRLIRHLRRNERTRLKILIEELNGNALAFLLHHKLKAVNIVRDYFSRPKNKLGLETQDAYVMHHKLPILIPGHITSTSSGLWPQRG